VEREKIQELTSVIGRRLREACGSGVEADLPVAIASRLAALREMEAHLANGLQDTVTSEHAALNPATTSECRHDGAENGLLDAKP
jgi:hypothetical protein